MTTTDTASEHDQLPDQPAPGFAQVADDDSEVLWVDPRELVIHANVRTDVALDKGFVADIAERGVRQVIPVRRDHSGRLVVRTGQRRVLAAIEAGLDGCGSWSRTRSSPTSGTGPSTGSWISSGRTSTAVVSVRPRRPAPPNSCSVWV